MSLSRSKFLLSIAVVGFLALSGAARAAEPAAAAAALTRTDVEDIVREYIKAHPGDILDAVQAYQDRAMRSQQVQAVKSNRETLLNDPLTPSTGNEDGDITVVHFFDYNCGYCKRSLGDIVKLLESDKKVRIVFKDFPILGPSSEMASKWALAAYKQKKYYEFFKALMGNRSPIAPDLLEKIAKDIGMDVEKARNDANSDEVLKQIERNRSLGANMNLHGTPAFVVGDDIAAGAVGFEALKGMVDKARAKAAEKKAEPADKKEGEKK